MKTIVTRRTKVGFGYNAGCSQHWNNDMTHSWLAPDPTEKPDYTGTFKQVCEESASDRTLASFRSGGTYYTTAWFVKVDGKWRKIIGDYDVERMGGLLMERDRDDYKYDGRKYYDDAIEVEVED